MSDKDDNVVMLEAEAQDPAPGDNDEKLEDMGQIKSKVKKLATKRKGNEEKEEEEFELWEETGEFMCGVVEGFYGRPWTTAQRKELFRRMKSMGMNTYLYGPKDDYKHRLYWRDLYSADETELLKLLIQAAEEHDVLFIYAISPGLDMAFASAKELDALKSKLLQVQGLGCKAFALLFDDIDPILCATDKEQYQSAGSAQAAVTNQMYEILNKPRFLFCPTEYCNSMAMPDVPNSKYLSTIGAELNKNISIMWTGPKVVSKSITVESIKQLTRVVRRRVVIWDNIHANDYDPKRVFLGPYKGRSTHLIPHLGGVLTNPNCEFESNFIAMHTLASWWKSHTIQLELEHAAASLVTVGLEKKSDVEMESDDEKKKQELGGKVEQPEDHETDPKETVKEASSVEKVESAEENKEETKAVPTEDGENQLPGNDEEREPATSAVSSGVSSLMGSDDSETDSDYSSHDDFYSFRRIPLSAPFDHGAYDPEQSLREAIRSWLPLFSTSCLPLGKPIARSGPPLGMPLPQYDVGRVSNAPIGAPSCTTNVLPVDPILSTAPLLSGYGSPAVTPNIAVKLQADVGKQDSAKSETKPDSNNPSNDQPEKVNEPNVESNDIDVEMVSTTPNLNSPGEMEGGSEASHKTECLGEKLMADVDMKPLPSETEKEETMQTGDAENSTMKRCESSVQMDTEDEEPMQFEADHDSDVSMATTASEDKKEVVKDELDEKENGSPSASSVDMATPPQPSSAVQSPEHKSQEAEVSEEPTEETTRTREQEGTRPVLFTIEEMVLEDVELAVELFYLPYEHGKIGCKMVEEFVWLQRNVHKAVTPPNATKSFKEDSLNKALEWMERAIRFEERCIAIRKICNKLTTCSNRALLYDLFPYFWDMKGVVSMLSSYVKWMGQFYLRHQTAKTPEASEAGSDSSKPSSPRSANCSPPPTASHAPFPPTPAVMWLGVDPEPWVFRGGLSGEFQRLLPITMANDLFCQVIPCSPHMSNTTYIIRPYLPADEKQVYKICLATGNDGTDFSDDFTGYEDLPGERMVGGLLTLSPQYCFVVEDEHGICGYLVGTSDAKSYWKKYSVAFLPEVKEKYPPLKDDGEGEAGQKLGEEVRRLLEEIHSVEAPDLYAVESLHSTHPAYMQIAVHRRVTDPSIAKSMTVCMLSALKSHGVHGVHTTVRSSDCYMPDLYTRLGFHEIRPTDPSLVTHVASCLPTYKDDTTIVFGRTF